MASNFCIESPWFDRSWTQKAPSNYQCRVGIWELLGFLNFLIGVKLLYNVVLVTAIQQCESAICIYVHLPSFLDSQEFKPVNPKGNQPWIFIRRTDAEAEALFGHLMWRADSLEMTLMLGKTEGKRKRGWQRMRRLDDITQWTWVWANSGRYLRTVKPGMLQSVGSQRVRHDRATEQQWQLI